MLHCREITVSLVGSVMPGTRHIQMMTANSVILVKLTQHGQTIKVCHFRYTDVLRAIEFHKKEARGWAGGHIFSVERPP